MQTHNQNNTNKEKKPEKKSHKLFWLIFLGLILVVVIIIFAVPTYLSSDSGNEFIRGKINQNVEGSTDFSDLNVGYTGNITISNFTYTDPNGLNKVSIERIVTDPHLFSLMGGNLAFGDTLLLNPEVMISIKDAKENIEEETGQEESEKAPAPILPVKRIDLRIEEGKVKIYDQEQLALSVLNLNSNLKLRPVGSESSLQMKANLGGDSATTPLNLTGTAKSNSSKDWTWQTTVGQFEIDVNDLSLESLEPIFRLADVNITSAGQLSADITADVTGGKFQNLQANVSGRNIRLSMPAFKGDILQTQDMRAAVQLSAKDRRLEISRFNVTTDFASLDLRGTLPEDVSKPKDLLAEGAEFALEGSLDVNFPQLANQFGNTLNLKKGTRVNTGTLTAEISTKSFDSKKAVEFNAKLSDLSASLQEKQLSISTPITADSTVVIQPEQISVEQFQLGSSFMDAQMQGTLDQLAYQAQVDLGKFQTELGSLFEIGYDLAGQVEKTGVISVLEDKTRIKDEALVTDLQITQGPNTLAEQKITIQKTMSIYEDRIEIENLDIDGLAGQISTSQAVIPLDEKTSMNIVMQAAIDLSEAEKYIDFFSDFPQEVQLTGQLNSTTRLSAKKNLYIIASDDTVIKNLKMSYPDAETFEQSTIQVDFIFEIDPVNKVRRLKQLNIISPAIKIEGASLEQKQTNSDISVQAQFQVNYDWQYLSNLLSPFMLPGLKITGQRSDTFTFRSRYATHSNENLLSNAYGRGQVGFDSAMYKGLKIGQAEAVFDVNQGILRLQPFSASANNGKFNFQAVADFTSQPYILKTPQPIQVVENVEINDEMSAELLKFINPLFADTADVDGKVNLYTETLQIPLQASALEMLVITGRVEMSDVYLGASDLFAAILKVSGKDIEEKVEITPTDFKLQDKVLTYDQMKVIVDDDPVIFSGRIGLDESLKMQVGIPYSWAGEKLESGQEGQNIEIPITGTLSDPQLDLSGLIRKPLEGLLQEQIEKGLKDIFD